MQGALSLLFALLLVAALPARALVPGDLMFTSFNADDDSWSLVVLVDMAPETTVYFSDNAWDSTARLFVGSESHHQWNSGPAPITAGTVVHFTQTDHAQLLAASVGTLSRVRVAGSSTYGLSQTAETLYAYQGRSAEAPTGFITALSTGGFASNPGGLQGTGLALGLSATRLAPGADFARYAGPRQGLTAEQFSPLAAAAENWADLGDGRYTGQVVNLTPFQVTPIPEPAALGLALTGLAVLGARQWWPHNTRRRSKRTMTTPPLHTYRRHREQ